MRRRDFIKVIAGSAVFPIVGHAQQNQRMQRIGVLMNLGADDKEGQARLIAFVQALSDLGWKNTSNVQIETCWGARLWRRCPTIVASEPLLLRRRTASDAR
jgi:putative tryptophan/tyrosine transport system substrate-binding protein